jgi:hypothetical protein
MRPVSMSSAALSTSRKSPSVTMTNWQRQQDQDWPHDDVQHAEPEPRRTKRPVARVGDACDDAR